MTTLTVFSNGDIKSSSEKPPVPQGDILYGLSDYQCDDPLGHPYCDKGFFPRNWTSRPSVPEVRRFDKSGDNLLLTEGIEWLLFYGLWDSNSGWSESYAKDMFARHTRDDGGFFNKVSWNSDNPRRSFVLDLNRSSKPMMLLGIVCPGGNVFRKTGSQTRWIEKDGVEAPYAPVWNLDYDWLASNITKTNAREFSKTIPNWLKFTAKVVHPERIGEPVMPFAPNGIFKVTNWDGNFWLPTITADGGKKAVVDTFHVRENYLAEIRVSPTPPNA